MVFEPASQSRVGGKYRLERCIAAGGMGSVWRAKHETLDVAVAIKLMSPLLSGTSIARARFEREAKASALLKSPHIVKVQDYGMEGETPFMVMELLEGEDLGERLARLGRLSLDETVQLATQIGKALKAAHDMGIVHRDLKPGNIFFAREGGEEIIKLLDFGIAHEMHARRADDRTSTGVIVGSPHHMSPEQAQAGAVDHRSDLWSFGVVLFRALTGRRPFDGDNLTAVLLAVVSHPVPSATVARPDLPKDLDRFFERALARTVSQRFQDAPAMADAFVAIASGVNAASWIAVAPTPAAKRGRDEPTVSAEPEAATVGRRSKARWLAVAGLTALTGLVVVAAPLPSSAPRRPEVRAAIAPPIVPAASGSERGRDPAPAASTAPPASTGGVGKTVARSRPAAKPTKTVRKPAIDSFTGLPTGR